MKDLKNKKILIVEDEPQLLKMLETILRKDGFKNIFCASTVSQGMSVVINHKPEIAVLDVMLPDGDGFSLLSEIKKLRDIPVLFLTAKGEPEDKILGLGLGADDYMVKPFLPKELTLRLNAILKRTYSQNEKEEPPVLKLSACTIDFGKAEVIRGQDIFPLTAKEYSILMVLYQNANNIVTTDTLCQRAWGEDNFGYENTLMVHMRRIREKIEDNPSNPVSLITVKGLGYKLLI
jgi:DNA-binding response OmpR family regulator